LLLGAKMKDNELVFVLLDSQVFLLHTFEESTKPANASMEPQ